ncbi:MAG: DUF2878 family protein [archaeon]
MKTKIRVKKEFFYELTLFIITVTIVSYFYRNNLLLTALLILLWGLSIMLWHTKQDVQLFITGAVFGTAIELVCTHFGVWHYGNPSFLGIPVWLPLAWGVFVVMIVRTADTFAGFWKTK